jgi:hypothetical protein
MEQVMGEAKRRVDKIMEEAGIAAAADVVLSYRPKPKTKPARRRKRQAAKNV